MYVEHVSEKIEPVLSPLLKYMCIVSTLQSNRMYYRAIKVTDGGAAVSYMHFTSITDSYKHFLPSLEDQRQDSWHIKLLWSVVEDFKCETDMKTTQKIGWNDVKNPEEDTCYTLYIQRVDHFEIPLPCDM